MISSDVEKWQTSNTLSLGTSQSVIRVDHCNVAFNPSDVDGAKDCISTAVSHQLDSDPSFLRFNSTWDFEKTQLCKMEGPRLCILPHPIHPRTTKLFKLGLFVTRHGTFEYESE